MSTLLDSAGAEACSHDGRFTASQTQHGRPWYVWDHQHRQPDREPALVAIYPHRPGMDGLDAIVAYQQQCREAAAEVGR